MNALQKMRPLLVPLAAVAAAIIVLNVLSFSYGTSPLKTLAAAAAGSWGTAYGIGQVLFKATPLLLAGIAVDVALRAGLFNIGVEGQLAIGTFAGTLVALWIPASTPAIVAVVLVLAAAALAGGSWAGIAGAMRVRFGAHEVISTIMLNHIAQALIAVLMTSWLALAGTVRTPDISPAATLPRLETLVPQFGASAANVSVFLALAILVAVFAWLRRTRSGRQTTWVGQNDVACAAEGIAVGRRRMVAMVLSGAIAAMAVASTVLGYKGYYEIGLGAGTGLAGIAVAFLGRGSPLGLVLAALLFGTLAQAGLSINAMIPREAMGILEAVVIVAVALADRAARREARAAGGQS